MFAAPTGPQLDVAARTDPGRVRAQNEDWMLAADPCFLVADGMGGHEAGDRASKAAISAFSEAFTMPGPATTDGILAALDVARARVAAIAAGTLRGAGCTLTGAIRIELDGVPHWYVLNVGDSRVYVQRDGELVQLTHDHSLREELLSEGRADAAATPRNVITRALGSDDSRHDAWVLPIETGSRLLICSDGLNTELDDQQLNGVLSTGGRVAQVADQLLARARDAGGRDNITLIVVDVVGGGVVGEPDFDDITLERTLPRPR